MRRARGSASLTAALVLALVATNAGWWLAWSAERTAAATARTQARAASSAVAEERARYERELEDTELQNTAARDAIQRAAREELDDAKAKSDAVVARLRGDIERLRRHWAGCDAAAPALPDDAAARRRADDAARLREEGARDLVRAGAEADAIIRGLQRYARLCSGGAS